VIILRCSVETLNDKSTKVFCFPSDAESPSEGADAPLRQEKMKTFLPTLMLLGIFVMKAWAAPPIEAKNLNATEYRESKGIDIINFFI
jgi:hypothetical protein